MGVHAREKRSIDRAPRPSSPVSSHFATPVVDAARGQISSDVLGPSSSPPPRRARGRRRVLLGGASARARRRLGGGAIVERGGAIVEQRRASRARARCRLTRLRHRTVSTRENDRGRPLAQTRRIEHASPDRRVAGHGVAHLAHHGRATAHRGTKEIGRTCGDAAICAAETGHRGE